MSTLILDNRALSLRADGRAIAIYASGQRQGTIPIRSIERLIIHGEAELTAGVIERLAEAGVTLLLLAKRKLERRALVLGPAHNDAAIRLGQAGRVHDSAFRRDWAAGIVRAKIRRQKRMLDRALGDRPDRRKPLFDALASLEGLLARVDTHKHVVALRGVEGAAARGYFAGLAALFPPALGFSGRNRRPPRDPVNACLSLGYTLLHFDAVRAAHIAGLDPMIGFYHRPAHGRESLASDLIEPLRPAVDAFVLRLFRDRRLRAHHFEYRDGACLLVKEGRARFYPAWEQDARARRRLLRRECLGLARFLRSDGERQLDVFSEEDWING